MKYLNFKREIDELNEKNYNSFDNGNNLIKNVKKNTRQNNLISI